MNKSFLANRKGYCRFSQARTLGKNDGCIAPLLRPPRGSTPYTNNKKNLYITVQVVFWRTVRDIAVSRKRELSARITGALHPYCAPQGFALLSRLGGKRKARCIWSQIKQHKLILCVNLRLPTRSNPFLC